jgi:hypothetical protein
MRPDGDHRARAFQRLRAAICILGFAALVVAVVYQGAFPGGILVIIPVAGVPLLGYVAWVRSPAGSIVAGVALLLITGGTALYVTERMEGGSSTAAVGYLYLLLAGVPVLLVTIIIERVLRARHEPSD